MSNIVAEKDQKKIMAMLRTALPSLAKVDDHTLVTAIAYAKHIGLDPLKKEVHLIPYYDKEQGKYVVQPVVAYTEYLKRAERSGKLKGWACIIKDEDTENPKAVVEIKRADWEIPFVWEVSKKEVAKDTPLWKSQPLFMLKKVAIAQAFRMCFPEETAHLPYEEAENWIPENNIPDQKTEEKKIDTQPETEDEYLSDEDRRKFFAVLKKLGYTKDTIKEILQANFGIESTKQIKKSQLNEIIEFFKQLSEPINL